VSRPFYPRFRSQMLIEARVCVLRGEPWQRLRQEDFAQVDLDGLSAELVGVIREMMRTEPAVRMTVRAVWTHPVVARAREAMRRAEAEARANGTTLFAASPLAGDGEGFLEELLGHGDAAMDEDW
jgi:mitosis inhibitor protein kinase SWE1